MQPITESKNKRHFNDMYVLNKKLYLVFYLYTLSRSPEKYNNIKAGGIMNKDE